MSNYENEHRAEVAKYIVNSILNADDEKMVIWHEALDVIRTNEPSLLSFNDIYEGFYATDPFVALKKNPYATLVGIHWVIIPRFSWDRRLIMDALDATAEARTLAYQSHISNIKMKIKRLQIELDQTIRACRYLDIEPTRTYKNNTAKMLTEARLGMRRT